MDKCPEDGIHPEDLAAGDDIDRGLSAASRSPVVVITPPLVDAYRSPMTDAEMIDAFSGSGA